MKKHPDCVDPNDIVAEFKVNGGTVYIMNTCYKDKSPDEIAIIDRNIARVLWQIVHSLREEGMDI